MLTSTTFCCIINVSITKIFFERRGTRLFVPKYYENFGFIIKGYSSGSFDVGRRNNRKSDFLKGYGHVKRSLVCPVCGREFTTDKNAMKYCSEFCRRKAARSLENSGVREFKCMHCGKKFMSDRRRKYCSIGCRVSANRGKTPSGDESTPSLTLSQVAFLSREAGLSYGKYVEKLRLA